jgi:uncharacterized protein (TIGR00725 family)
VSVKAYVAVVGPEVASASELQVAEGIGRELAQAGVVVLTGGLGGVMAAACRGAQIAGGLTVGLLPGMARSAANRWTTVALTTGLGELRNGLLVRAADAVIAVGGAYGTLSEVALALKTGVPVVGLRTWAIDGVVEAVSAAEAVKLALGLADAGDGSGVADRT